MPACRRLQTMSLYGLFLALLTVSSPLLLAAPQAAPHIENVTITPGGPALHLHGTLKGYAYADYLLCARQGQQMTVSLRASNSSTYFNVLPPGEQEALFNGAVSGDRFHGLLPQDGVYTVRVYLMRNAARRNAVTRYRLALELTEIAVRQPGQKDMAPESCPQTALPVLPDELPSRNAR